jgi:hypothetical protein
VNVFVAVREIDRVRVGSADDHDATGHDELVELAQQCHRVVDVFEHVL